MAESTKSIQKLRNAASILASGAGLFTAATLTVAGGWILYSNLGINHKMPLRNAIEAEKQVFFGGYTGKLACYSDRQVTGRPLVLIHSLNAAASSFEMHPLFDYYRSRRPVFALDLPGFGFSERSRRVYRPLLYRDAILDMLATQVGEPADVVALSLGCEFAARAAVSQPERFNSLALISPTGLNRPGSGKSSQRASFDGRSDQIHDFLSRQLWSRALFDLVATRRSIQFFLQRSFMGAIAPGLVDYAYATAHQPGAQYAPLYFLSGKLFTPAVRTTVYEIIKVPTLVIYDRDGFTRFDMLSDLQSKNIKVRSVRISPTLGLPQFEKPAETIQALDNFWEE